MQILDGKKLQQKILADLKSQIKDQGLKPRLDIVLVGDNKSSLVYVQQKQKVGQDLGVNVQIHQLDPKTNTVRLLNLIQVLNQKPEVKALMVQLPLPPQINRSSVLNHIDPKKDVDGLSPTNLGRLFIGHKKAVPSATAAGIIRLLKEYKIDPSGKHAVIVGRSPEVALPLFALLQNQNATVTICHSKTKNLKSLCQQADILISSTGQPKLITADFVKQGAVVIDVGYPKADVDFDRVKTKASAITPVPGGVGPMTIASLFSNLVKIYQDESSAL